MWRGRDSPFVGAPGNSVVAGLRFHDDELSVLDERLAWMARVLGRVDVNAPSVLRVPSAREG